jgi:TetR/AcrR family transcriptional regulator, cholesterol catabolism regulator
MERSIARRLGILRAAAEAFRRYGFADTGMREIAEVADLSPGNLYYYFANKQELLFFCQDYSLDLMIESVGELQHKRMSADERLRKIIERQLRFMLEELDGAAAHLEVDALPVLMRARIIKKRDTYEALMRKVIVEGMRTGVFRRVDAGLVTRAILGAINWTARWYRPGGPQPVAEVASAFADYLVRGLLK